MSLAFCVAIIAAKLAMKGLKLEETSKLRIRSAMVIYEFERALARYIKDRNIDLSKTAPVKEIVTRVLGNALENGRPYDLDFILENSYINEAIQLAELAATNSSHSSHLKRIRVLCEALELFDMRNAVSHPNRQFPECYWYRCCALASDPGIGLLGLLEVSNAWGSAISGKLEEPPEEWLSKPRWTVPAMLPLSFEHSATGLIGRRKDTEALIKELKNPRAPLISVVARGGVGKTSLVLQVLSDFCISAESARFMDGVIFVSLKTERLTATGIEPLLAPQSISELCRALTMQLDDLYGGDHIEFSDALLAYSDKRTCVFIDNLETLLRDSPYQFLELYDGLPAKWKVIVTSRIPLDGGKNMPLEPLDEGGAVALARGYFISKGVAVPHPETVERLTSLCDRNPLAIRLAIDRYTAGGELDTAAYEVHKDVIAFSFSNLIEVLSSTANQILEALFVLEESNRVRLCDALAIDMDNVSMAISELARTSLIVRRDGDAGEQYSLGASIRDLLRSNPRNLKVRSSILDWLARSKAAVSEAMRVQQERNLSPLNSFFMPSGTPASSIAIAKDVQRACRRDDFKALAALDVRIRQLLDEQGATSFLCRLHARVFVAMQDRNEAERSLRAAIRLDPVDPSPVVALSSVLMKSAKYSEAEVLLAKLIEDGWGSPEKSGDDCARVWSVYLQALNWQDKIEQALLLTQDWKTSGIRETVFGTARVQSYRRQAARERQNGASIERIWTLMDNALITVDHIIRKSGYSDLLKAEIKKSIGDIVYYLRRSDMDLPSRSILDDLNAFLATHANMVRELCADDWIFIMRTLDLNFSESENKTSGAASDQRNKDLEVKIKGFADDGYKIVTIHHIPKTDGYPHFLFAFDENDNRYYLHESAFEGGNTKRWVQLTKGSRVAIRYLPSERGRVPVATEIIYLHNGAAAAVAMDESGRRRSDLTKIQLSR